MPKNTKIKSVNHAIKLLSDGADLIDVGGESTRPGSKVMTFQRHHYLL